MLLVLDRVSLLEHGPTMSLTVKPGETLCIVGPAASGKSKLIRTIAGIETADRGEVSRPDKVGLPETANRKLRPQDLSHRKGANQAATATATLSDLGLWDVRQRSIADLTPAQIMACDMVAPFMSGATLLAFDGCLDEVDPWARQGILKLIRDRCSHGTIAAITTNNLDMAGQFDHLIVLKEYQAVFVGSVADLVRDRGQRSVTIESERNLGVRALVQPLLVGVTQTDKGYVLQPGPGQEHTARLLRDGYGDVKYVIVENKPLAEIILSML